MQDTSHAARAGNLRESTSPMLWGVVKAARIVIASILAIAEPVIVGSLSAITIVCAVLATFYGFIAKSAHFPMMTVIGIGVGSALSACLYYALMAALLGEE